MTTRTVRLLVADDHTLLREALCEILTMEPGFEIVAQASSGPATIRLVAQHRPDVVLLDAEMPHSEARVTVQRLLATNPGLHIIVLSMHDDAQLVQDLLNAGIRGYLHKSVSRETLVSAIHGLADGDSQVVTVSISHANLTPRAVDEKGLSSRELEVLNFVASAMSNRQVASRLEITEGTVKRHLRNIFAKLEAVSRIDAVNKAIALSLIKHPAGGSRPQ